MAEDGSRRRRLLLVVHDVELALELVAALEDAGHYADHVFDISEALLRASLTLPDVLVVDLAAPELDYGVLRRWGEQNPVPLVVLSSSASGERSARRLGATFFPRPKRNESWAAEFVDVVQTAVMRFEAEEAAAALADDAAPTTHKRSGTMLAAPRVLIAAPGENAREVVASFVRSQLGLGCITVPDAAAATLQLHHAPQRIRAVLMDRRLMLEPAGRALDRAILELGIAMIPLRIGSDDDATAIGRAAWDVAPMLRAALAGYRAHVG